MMDELDILKAQHKLLQQTLEQQKIVNKKLIHKATSRKIGSLRRQLTIELFFGLFAVPYCTFAFYHLGCSVPFCIATQVFLMSSVIYQYFTRRCYGEELLGEVPITEMARRAAKAKIRTARQFRMGMMILAPWFLWAAWELGNIESATEAERIGIVIGATIGGMVGLAIGYRLYNRHQKIATELIDQLKELENLQDDKS